MIFFGFFQFMREHIKSLDKKRHGLACGLVASSLFLSLAHAQEDESFEWLGDTSDNSLLEISYGASLGSTNNTSTSALAVSLTTQLSSSFALLDSSTWLLDFSQSTISDDSETGDFGGDTKDRHFYAGFEGGTTFAPLVHLSHTEFEDRYRENLIKFGVKHHSDRTETAISVYALDISNEFTSRSSAVNSCIDSADLYSELRFGLSIDFAIALGSWIAQLNAKTLESSSFDEARDDLTGCIRDAFAGFIEQREARLRETEQANSLRSANQFGPGQGPTAASSETEFTLQLGREIGPYEYSIGASYIDSELIGETVLYSFGSVERVFADRYLLGLSLIHEDFQHSEQIEVNLGYFF